LVRAIAKCGYDSPTLVQSQTLSVALSGHDALITAATGSGKTLAYIWPMIIHINDQHHIEPGIDGPIGIVLTPTRELAKQVYTHAKTFIECIGGKAVEVAGGNRGTWELTKELKKGCEIVVSSPGRLIDMVKKKGTNLKRVTFLVLDEADRMLSMGFEKQVNSVLENVRPDRQTLLLSATFGKRVEKVARSWLRNPVR
jgi:ATP-dependent RNA helicase DDX42